MLTKTLLTKVIGSRNDRILKRLRKKVEKINALEAEFEKLTDDELKAETETLKAQLETSKLDDILIEAFAVVREASKRVLEMRHYDVQLIGGMVLHMGKIAEMRTGEGKTLVATLAVYLNALSGKGVHVVTVNDYLASRDAQLMGKLYGFLGLSTGVIVSGLTPEERKEAYACDITYGTNNEFGFDYLRDNMAFSKDEQVQRSRNFVVIDEVDSILIDEARTPLIISGAAEDSSQFYLLFTRLVQKLEICEDKDGEGEGDYYLDEKSKQAHLTEAGHSKIESWLIDEGILAEGENLYSPQHVTKMYYLNAALRATTLYQQNVDYMVANNEIVIVDEHTGRAMPGRRWSDGLHQAIEAKEGVKIQGENQTLASITFQNFFRLYDKISGMTGTADTEASEFHEIYSLEVIVIPTNKPPKRIDHSDLIYSTQKEKFQALIDDIKTRIATGQPILVGTASIETSEILSTMMRKRKIPHNVLNAKQHEKEAKIIAQAGKPGNVTIATNMAGRGTDIILGGSWQEEINELEEPSEIEIARIKSDWQKRNQQVIDAGGLCILGSERHDSRRIDNQLRGRAARQGDPGESSFYLSLDDHLLRIFMPPRMIGMLRGMMKKQGEVIDGKMITKAIAKAQAKVESYHFDMRKNVLEYDNVANEQRKVIYGQRDELLSSIDVSEVLKSMRYDVADATFHNHIPKQSIEEQWDVTGLTHTLDSDFGLKLSINQWLEDDESLHEETLKERVINTLMDEYDQKIESLDQKAVHQFEKVVLLQSLDTHWREHLSSLDHLRNSIHLRGYAQKDPKQEYKREAFELFSSMLDNFKYEVVSTLTKIHIERPEEEVHVVEDQWRHSVGNLAFNHEEVATLEQSQENQASNVVNMPSDEGPQEPQEKPQPFVRPERKVSRNEPCPCGSGKKYKHCHGALQ